MMGRFNSATAVGDGTTVGGASLLSHQHRADWPRTSLAGRIERAHPLTQGNSDELE
jgi:hypothetical protein